MTLDLQDIDWAKTDGLIPAVVQDAARGDVLMVGYMNREAIEATQSTGLVTFFSRSKQRLWQKGETSGHVLKLVEIKLDCDGDTLLVLANPVGPTCHLGTDTCFGPRMPGPGVLGHLAQVIEERRGADPATSYTAKLLNQGTLKIAQKVGEEGVETALAAAAQGRERVVSESADLLYHLLVLWEATDVAPEDVWAELARRHHPKTPPKP